MNQAKKIFRSEKKVVLAYFFGSRQNGQDGPLSDYDLAIYLREKDRNQRHKIKFQLEGKLSRALKTDKIDIVIINDVDNPELSFNILKSGELIYQQEPYKVIIEPKILNRYFDFILQLRRFNLTKA